MLKFKSKTSELVEILERKLLSGAYSNAKGIPSETEICEIYKTSRSTVREAVSILVSRGLLERRHGVGLIVVNNTLNAGTRAIDLAIKSESIPGRDILEIRKVLEVQSAGWSAKRRTWEDLDEMFRAINIMESSTTSFEDYVDADFNFHMALVHSSQNVALSLMMESVAASIRELIRATVREKHRPEVSNGFHRAIFDAVAVTDSERAMEQMQAHMRATDLLLDVHSEQTSDS